MKISQLASKQNLELAWRRITTGGNYQYTTALSAHLRHHEGPAEDLLLAQQGPRADRGHPTGRPLAAGLARCVHGL